MKARLHAGMALDAVVRAIVDHQDHGALDELVSHRTLFFTYDESELLFIPYLRRLAADATSDGWCAVEVDFAVSLTTDKFTCFPNGSRKLDCRKLYGAALETVRNQFQEQPVQSEKSLAQMLNQLVRKQFNLALREARRSNTRTRFVWRINGEELRLLFPVTMTGRARAKWLETNAADVDPRREGEQERVQNIINTLLGAQFVPLESIVVADAAAEKPGHALERISVVGLAACVADEKAALHHTLRPSIRKLGPHGVGKLVMEIFGEIGESGYCEGSIAKSFGLDPASMSRFAGSRWKHNGRVPDLWRNLARLLASHDRFFEACREAGVWETVQKVVRPALGT